MKRFLDSNIFIYAFYKSGHHLSPLDKKMKDSSKKVITDVSEGREAAITSVVHVSEVVHILKHSFTAGQLSEIVSGIFTLDNAEIIGVCKEEYFTAKELGQELEIDPNDALAFQVMQSSNTTEIYSFDRAFDKVEGIMRLPSLGSYASSSSTQGLTLMNPFRE